MFKLALLIVVILSWQCALFAQSSSTQIGARASGIGYASSALTDEWSIFNNVAGLARLTSIVTAFTYDAQPTFKPFNKTALTFNCPLKIGVAGLGLFRFGDDLYSEQIATLGYSTTFGLASLGLRLNYIQYSIKGFGSKGVVTVCFGGIAELTKRLFVGAHVLNINQPKLSQTDRERVPTVLFAGLLFKATEDATVTVEVEKDLDHKGAIKAGLEYRILKKFFVRTGIRLQPNTGYFGFGFKPTRYSIDYSFQHTQGIGSRHQASICYRLNNKAR